MFHSLLVCEDNLHYEKFADGSVKCIEDEVPFDLPDGWAWARLTSICLKITDGTHHSPDSFPTGEYKYVTAKNIKLNGIVLDDITYVTAEVHREIFARCNPEIGDILYIKDGATSGIATVNTLHEEFSLLSSVALLKPAHEINNWYMCYAMQSPYFYSTTRGDMKGVGITRITLNMLASRLIPVPPQNEQQRISVKSRGQIDLISSIESDKGNIVRMVFQAKAKILDLAIRGQLVPQDPDDEPASVLLERIRAEKEELIKQGKIKRDKKESVIFRGEDNSYYEKMADGKLHCLDDQLPFELPDGWEWCNLSMIGTTNIGLTYRPTDIEPGGIMVLRSCNIVNDQVDLSGLVRVKTTVRENQFAQKNDILICARNGSGSLVGKCALIPDLREPASFGAFMAIYRTEYFEFIVHYLRSSFFRSVFDDSNSTAINQLTQDMLKRAIVPLPPLSEQRRIVEAIGAMLFELNQMEKSLS